MVRIHFECYCPTRWGQEVFVVGSHEKLGNWDYSQAIHLKCFDLNRWRGMVEIAGDFKQPIDYKYILFDREKQEFVDESGKNRSISPQKGTIDNYQLLDSWHTIENYQFALLSSAFTDVLFKPDAKFAKGTSLRSKHILEFKLIAPLVGQGEFIALAGNCAALGNWDVQKAIPFKYHKKGEWVLPLDAAELPASFEYKFVLKNENEKDHVIWQEGPNGQFILNKQENASSIFIYDAGIVMFKTEQYKFAGTSVPVFSLRTDKSFGAGDFSDLKKFIDWAALNNMKMLQILPINDTISTFSFLDSYPYKSISVFALHPLYLDIFKLGKLKDKKKQTYFEKLQKELNAFASVDYEKVVDAKLQYFRSFVSDNQEDLLSDDDYLKFFKTNKDWLIPYAAFSVLRDKYHTSDFSKWEKFRTYKKTDIQKLGSKDSDFYNNIQFYYLIQYFLDKQLREASDYAHQKQIILKGDIPIGISRFSVDAWANPELFHFNGQAGAPPDDFSITGQNWGFPTYNWEVMEKDHFKWWRDRLTKMNDFFDAYRIDHILGFFRIWEIPFTGVEGLMGRFRPALPLSVDELQLRGAWFDYNRLCRPYIREHMLGQIFGEQAEMVKNTYLDDKGHGIFDLKEKYANQRKIYESFVGEGGPESLPDDQRNLLYNLMRLAAEVVLIPDDQEGFYHPRISMHSTFSYQELDGHQRHILDVIYIDYFYHRHEHFWKQQAMQKMPALVNATDMLICGEDLGMIPASVPIVMNHFGILSLEIQRMPKDPKKQFAHPADAPYLSVCTPSTHDMSGIRGWWEESREVTQHFYNQQLGHWGEAPEKAETWICKEMINQHFHSPAMWVVIPIQDLLAMDDTLRLSDPNAERINEPANPRHYWRYRMHLSVDELLKANDFNTLLQNMIKESNRD